jgi:hypothetical protein
MITNDLFVPEVWGPSYWTFLHTSLFQYPEHPTNATKKIYYNLITNFGMFIPNDKIKSQYNELLNKYPITPYLENRTSIVKWGWFFHNKINEKLKKRQISIEDFYKDFYNSHQNYTFQISMKWFRSIKDVVFYCITIGILIYISYILYTYPYLVL